MHTTDGWRWMYIHTHTYAKKHACRSIYTLWLSSRVSVQVCTCMCCVCVCVHMYQMALSSTIRSVNTHGAHQSLVYIAPPYFSALSWCLLPEGPPGRKLKDPLGPSPSKELQPMGAGGAWRPELAAGHGGEALVPALLASGVILPPRGTGGGGGDRPIAELWPPSLGPAWGGGGGWGGEGVARGHQLGYDAWHGRRDDLESLRGFLRVVEGPPGQTPGNGFSWNWSTWPCWPQMFLRVDTFICKWSNSSKDVN